MKRMNIRMNSSVYDLYCNCYATISPRRPVIINMSNSSSAGEVVLILVVVTGLETFSPGLCYKPVLKVHHESRLVTPTGTKEARGAPSPMST